MTVTNGLNTETGVLLAKRETTYGSDSSPTIAANALPVVRKPTLQYAIQHAQPMMEGPRGGMMPGPMTAQAPVLNYTVNLYAKGLTTSKLTPTNFLLHVLNTCGDTDLSASTGTVGTWSPNILPAPSYTDVDGSASTGLRSATYFGYMGLVGRPASGTTMLCKLLGGVVQRIVFNLSPQGLCSADVTVLGIGIEPADQTLSGGGVSLDAYTGDGAVADWFVGNGLASEFGLTSASGSAQEFDATSTRVTVDFGAQHVIGDGGTVATGGVSHVAVGDISVTIETGPVLPTQAVFDWWGFVFDPVRYNSGSFDPAFWQTSKITVPGRTADTGYSLRWNVPCAQLIGENDRGGQNMRMPGTLTARHSTYTSELLTMTMT